MEINFDKLILKQPTLNPYNKKGCLPAASAFYLVELTGLEPVTPTMST